MKFLRLTCKKNFIFLILNFSKYSILDKILYWSWWNPLSIPSKSDPSNINIFCRCLFALLLVSEFVFLQQNAPNHPFSYYRTPFGQMEIPLPTFSYNFFLSFLFFFWYLFWRSKSHKFPNFPTNLPFWFCFIDAFKMPKVIFRNFTIFPFFFIFRPSSSRSLQFSS